MIDMEPDQDEEVTNNDAASQSSDDDPANDDEDHDNLPDRFLEPDIKPDFVPAIDELKTCLEFISALKAASLDNGDLNNDALLQLHNPPQYVLEISDPNDINSLEQFLATKSASQDTYNHVRQNHNACDPENYMLSYNAIKSKVSEWSGVEPIVHNMCLNSCIAYNGPFTSLEVCLKCSHSRFNPILLEQSNGKIKMPSQQFYTLPVGPHIQALW
jgi:hypothetical protein